MAPLQSKNDIAIIDPFKRNMGPPHIETMYGCVVRFSKSGGCRGTVNTEPKLVPIHNVGTGVVGSVKKKHEYT